METEQKPKRQSRPKRNFSDEFKAGAVRLVLEEGKTPAEVSRALDVHQSVIGQWVRRAKADRGKGRLGDLTSSEREELARLRKENRQLLIERAILKKAAAFFAKESE